MSQPKPFALPPEFDPFVKGAGHGVMARLIAGWLLGEGSSTACSSGPRGYEH